MRIHPQGLKTGAVVMGIPPFSIIVAVDHHFGIGKKGSLPWHLPGELKHFKEVTTHVSSPGKKNIVLMGRKTWDSLPVHFKPLPGRINLVLSRQRLNLPDGVWLAGSFSQAFALIQERLPPQVEQIFVIGGAGIFKQALEFPECRKIYLTKIMADFDCDVYFPADLSRFAVERESALMKEKGIAYRFVELTSRLSPAVS